MPKPSWLDRSAIIAEQIERALLVVNPELQAVRSAEGVGLSHALFMARALQSRLPVDAGDDVLIDSDTKACRWLGYLQAILVYEGAVSLADAKEANRTSKLDLEGLDKP